jgi:hypothetical protein
MASLEAMLHSGVPLDPAMGVTHATGALHRGSVVGRWLPDGQGGAQSVRRWPNSLMWFSVADIGNAGPTIVVRATNELSASLSPSVHDGYDG